MNTGTLQKKIAIFNDGIASFIMTYSHFCLLASFRFCAR